MANRFDKKGGFADMAAIQRERSKTTPEKIDEIIDWRTTQKILHKKLDRKANAVGNPAFPPWVCLVAAKVELQLLLDAMAFNLKKAVRMAEA